MEFMMSLDLNGVFLGVFLLGGVLGFALGYCRAGRVWANNSNDVFGIRYAGEVYKVVSNEQYAEFIALSDDDDDDYSNMFKIVRHSNDVQQSGGAVR